MTDENLPPTAAQASPPPDHLQHIQRFLLEMYRTMVDPVEEFQGNIEQLCELLLQRAREDRQAARAKVAPAALRELIAKFRDLAVELEKHSNDHIHDDSPENLQAAVEGVCADRIKGILAGAAPASEGEKP